MAQKQPTPMPVKMWRPAPSPPPPKKGVKMKIELVRLALIPISIYSMLLFGLHGYIVPTMISGTVGAVCFVICAFDKNIIIRK